MRNTMKKRYHKFIMAGTIVVLAGSLVSIHGQAVSISKEKPLAGITLSLDHYCETVIADAQEDAAQASAQANKCSDEDTAAFVGGLMTLLNNYINSLTRKQIKQAFEQSQKEVDDLHERTREGIQTARLAGKQIGQREGAKLTVKKAAPAKAAILKHCADFGGTLSDKECMQLAGVSRNTYFKYKRELKEQQ